MNIDETINALEQKLNLLDTALESKEKELQAAKNENAGLRLQIRRLSKENENKKSEGTYTEENKQLLSQYQKK